jgi:CDP-diacylglycerol--serine O-phosphatidyltransferase
MTFFLMAVVIILVALNPPAVLLGMALTYALSGPAGWLWGRIARKPSEPVGEPAPASPDEALPHEG